MRILVRYVLREFTIPLFYCLTGFVSIYVLFELFGSFSRLLNAHLPFTVAVLYFCGYLAPYFHYLAPAALMLATLYTMWMFCRHSEIVAMRASGISFMTIVKPLLAVAALMALFVGYVNECFVPEYAEWAERMKKERFDLEKMKKTEGIVFYNPRANRTWNIDAFGNREGTVVKMARVVVDRPQGARLLTVTADRAEYLDGEWWFHEPRVQHHDEKGAEIASLNPEQDALPLRCFPEFTESPADFRMQNRPWKYCSVRERVRYVETHPEVDRDRCREMVYDTWAQILSPLACLIITLFAIPAGIASGRQSVFRGILGALGMFFAFYGVVIGCMVVAKTGYCPPVFAAWLPYVIFFVLGVRSFLKQR